MNDTPPASAHGSSGHQKSACGPRHRRVLAVVLFLVGVLVLAGRELSFDYGHAMPLLLGLAFLAAAFLTAEGGLLVPGGILTGVGSGLLVQRLDGSSGAFFLCFAGGWLLIVALSWLRFGKKVWWPLYPAAVMVFIGLLQFAGPESRHWWRALRPYWPYGLIAAAVVLFFSKPRWRD